MSGYWIEDARGSRRAQGDDFPLAIGGPSTDIQVDDDGDKPLAYLGLADGEIFVQPAADGYPVVCNGTALETSQWLRDGDLLRFGAARLSVGMGHGETRFAVSTGGESPAPRLTPPPKLTPPPGRPPASAGHPTVEPIRFEPKPMLETTGRRRRLRPTRLLVALPLLALVAVAGFLLTSRSVLVDVAPAPDRLEFVDGFAVELGGRHLLRPGTYTLVAEKAGFRPLETTVEVSRDLHQTLHFELDKLPGRLTLLASAPGAEAWVDGEPRGPLTDALELTPGVHRIEVRAERYQDFVTEVGIEGAGTEQSLEVELLPRWADVTFASQPAGARVRLAGEELGKTPLTAEALDGSHVYDLVLAGFKPHRGRLTVVAGEPQTLPAVSLRPSDGNLVLSSEPDGATVSLNGEYRGETPLDLYLDPRREHEVSVSKAGYATRKQALNVASGQTEELLVELEPEEGEVKISAWPPGAELFVDGEPRGPASQTLTLQSLAHRIEVRKDGFVTHTQELTPLPGVPQWLEVTLKPVGQAREEARAAANPPVLETAGGHQLRKIQPGRFQMGASRREPGRRSNEVLREIELTRPFYIATHEVSNKQFRQFKKDHFSGQAGGHNLEIDHHPAVRLSWQDAAAYCNWLSRQDQLPPAYVEREGQLVPAVPMTGGYRLPTEAEWAWAARYDNESTVLKYPWGDSLPVAAGSGNYGDAAAQGFLPGALTDYNDGFPTTAPVDSFAASPRGLHNLGGNVAEWVQDFYAIRMGGSKEVERDPAGPTEGEFHVIRGSSWMHSTITELRWTFRDYGDKPRPDVGFRIARNAE